MKKRVTKVDGLTTQQERAIVALVTQPSIAMAAKSADVCERTLYFWLKQPAFQARHREARRDCFAQAIGMCQRATPVAVNVLAKIMSDNSAPFNSRVAAAVAVLKFGRDALELDDLNERISALEQQVGHNVTDDIPADAKHVINVDAKGIADTPDDAASETSPENKGETTPENQPENDDI